jgi:NADH-quinone oxidoreductase subunit E
VSGDARDALRSAGGWALGPAAPPEPPERLATPGAAPPTAAPSSTPAVPVRREPPAGPDERARKRERIVDVLWDLQQKRGWLDDEAIALAAAECGLTPAEADEIATFYNLLLRKPAGRTPIFVCDSISCELNGAPRLIAELEAALGIDLGGVTPDGAFGLLPIVCLGHCERAPCLLAGTTVHGPIDPDRESVQALLERIRDGARPAPGGAR